MNAESHNRFEELDAGRALGDLSMEEMSEWEILSRETKANYSMDFDWLATEIEINHAQDCSLSSSLANSLKASIPKSSRSRKSKLSKSGKIVAFLPWAGWGLAACLAFFINLPSEEMIQETQELTLAQKFDSLLQGNTETQRLDFASASEPYAGLSGEVIWNDDRQEGYMALTNLAANDPKVNQYQLWIVDPDRDELPVDGGVFDISKKDGTSIIPIRNTLPVDKPVAFVITLEQPGGVVKSKQEVVVALAKS